MDPYDPAALQSAAEAHGDLSLGEWLLTTHHHDDHSGGNAKFVADHPDCKVVAGSDTSPQCTMVVSPPSPLSL